MNCTFCGHPLCEGDKFCSACGAKTEPFAAAVPAQSPNMLPVAAVKPPEPVTAGQRWLLLGVLLLGVIFQFYLFRIGESAYSDCWYAAFWLAYLALFHVVCWKKVLARPLGFLPAAVAVFLCVMVIGQADIFERAYLSDRSTTVFEAVPMLWLDILAIPCVLMLHAQYVARPLPKEHESGYFVLFFIGFFFQPFQYMGRFFAGAGSLFLGKGKNRAAWLGVLIALPVLVVVTALLLSADAVMNDWAQKMLRNFNLSEFVWRLIFSAVCAILFYSFLYGARWGKEKEFQLKEYSQWGAAPFNVVLAALAAIYAVFSAVQFVYLFAGQGLPDGLTYSQYAVQGFNQLMWVAAINFTVLSLCLCRAQRTRVLNALMLVLLLMTAVILASAFTRLLLYIGAYGLTFRRVLAFWFLCYLGAVMVFYGARSFTPKFPLLRVSTLLFLLWYVALNLYELAA